MNDRTIEQVEEHISHCAAMIAVCRASGLSDAEAEYRKAMQRLQEERDGLDKGTIHRVLQ